MHQEKSVAEAISVLLTIVQQDREELRHIETQRSTLAGLIAVMASVAIGLIAQMRVSPQSALLSFLLLVLGVYGAVASAKLNERHWYFRERIDEWYKALDHLPVGIEVLKLRDEAKSRNAKRFPAMQRIFAHHIWLTLYILITLIGVILCMMALLWAPFGSPSG